MNLLKIKLKVFTILGLIIISGCGENSKSSDSFKLQPNIKPNGSPVADAGIDQSIELGEQARFDASNSKDIDGDDLTYTWMIVSKPSDNVSELEESSKQTLFYTPLAIGEYQISLVVNDGASDSERDIVRLFVSPLNLAPISDPGVSSLVTSGDLVTLDGSASRDEDTDGRIESYLWKSEDINVELSFSSTVTSTFVAPLVSSSKDYIFTLSVTDNNGAVSSSTVTITVVPVNKAPMAIAKADNLNGAINQLISIDGSNSFDPEEDDLSYSWSFISTPDSTPTTIEDPRSLVATFTPTIPGDYTIELIVTDSRLLSNSSVAVITVVDEDNPLTPKMVMIPSGTFQMGDERLEAGNNKLEIITIGIFEMGMYEVTFEEYDQYLMSKGIDPSFISHCCGESSTGGLDRAPKKPVIGISWDDIQDYLVWLNNELGLSDSIKKYRLPTGAEWEYAARAKTKTAYYTGDCVNGSHVNYDGSFFYEYTKSDGVNVDCPATNIFRAEIAEVDDTSFVANPFGLFHMMGNVWEWTDAICYEDSCISSSGGVRGGSWLNSPKFLRSASVNGLNSGQRYIFSLGFRLARGL